MPLFMDVHTFGGSASVGDLIRVCEADLVAEGRFGITYLRYWVSETAGKVFCLIEAESPDLISAGHGRAPGLVAHEVYPVSEHVSRWPGPGRSVADRSTRGRGEG